MNSTTFNLDDIANKIAAYKNSGLELFVTSSFQTHSIPLLHIISNIDRSIPVCFLNTGYHFPETLQFRDQIEERLGLNVQNLISPIPKHQQRDANGRLMYTSNPDYSSYMNKVLPMKPVLKDRDVWINGVRKDQTENRRQMNTEERTPEGVLRYHPMLDWNSKMIWEYRQAHDLPEHPLTSQGYRSIGNEPETQPVYNEQDERSARWQGMQKTECGLHTELKK